MVLTHAHEENNHQKDMYRLPSGFRSVPFTYVLFPMTYPDATAIMQQLRHESKQHAMRVSKQF